MGRFKRAEIKGLLIDNFGDIFVDAFNNAVRSTGLPEDQVLEKIAPEFKKLLSDYEEKVSSFYLENHKLKLDSFLKTHFNNQKRIAKENEKSFVPLILYVDACVCIYRKVIDNVQRKRIDNTLKINIALYGLLVRRAQEIIDLLLCGYIDAAMIIWRSLYENAIVLLVLAIENDNELANKYYLHAIRNSRKKIISYNDNHKELKFPPLSPATEKKLSSEIGKIETKYGKKFLDSEYGWADSLFNDNKKASLRSLEEKVKMNRFRPYYLLCSEHIHPGFSGMRNYMQSNKIVLNSLLEFETGLKSFIDPMQFTVSVLHEINDYILYEFSTEEEFNVNMLLLEKIFEKQQNSFNPKSEKRKKLRTLL